MKRAWSLFALILLRASIAGAEGKLPIEMGWSEAESYLQSRGFKVQPGRGEPNSLRTLNALDGLTYTFSFQAAGTASPPLCIGAMGIGPIDWQAQVAAMTGVAKEKVPQLKGKSRTGKVKLGLRVIPFSVEVGDAGVYIGKCD
jgi:hypothetical protein